MAVTREMIFDDLDSAIENGYGERLAEYSAIEICMDLIAFAADCEDSSVDELLPHVLQWLKNRKLKMWGDG